MTTLLIATRNAHKVAEIQAILGTGFACRPLLAEFPAAPIAVEDADTFAGNALKKAESLSHWLAASLQAGGSRDGRPTIGATRTFVLADDSGLEVDALGGAPGVHSARFAAMESGRDGNSPDADNNAKLLRLLATVPREKRTARFRCALALVEFFPAGMARKRRTCSTGRARGGLILPRVATVASATIRCSFPLDETSPSPNWERT